MVSNRCLKEHIQKRIDQLLALNFDDGVELIREWDAKLRGLANTRYSGKGEDMTPLKPFQSKQFGNQKSKQVNKVDQVTCFHCGEQH